LVAELAACGLGSPAFRLRALSPMSIPSFEGAPMGPSHEELIGCPYCRFTPVYRNKRTGKVMVAAAYGHKAWCFPCKVHRKKKTA
jgi:hypothetical protein